MRQVKKIAASGLDDLPLEVAVAIEEAPARQEPAPTPAADDSVANLVARLTAIRERIWRLKAVYAVSLSHDAAIEADRYVRLFQDIAAQLKAKDATALDALTRGHESLLLSPPIPVKQTIPAATQSLVELRWEAMTLRRRKPQPPTVPDGLDWMLK